MKQKIVFRLLAIIILASVIYSCEKEEEQPVAYGDAIIRSYNRGDSVVYGLCFFTYAYQRIKEATVSKTGSLNETVLDSTNNRFTFAYLPDSVLYSSTKPEWGEYTFNVLFDDGNPIVVNDYLDSTCMTPPEITKFKFDSLSIILFLDWETVTYADQYRILIENDKNEVVFQSDMLSKTASNLDVNTSTDGWLTGKQPKGGENYRIIIIAYQYESVASALDLQSISFTISDYFKWNINNN